MSQNKEAIQWRNQIVNLFSVFIGVYIAFALNKYQANNDQARLQKQYLTSLKNDLVKDLDLIQTDILQLDTLKYKNTRLISYSRDQFDPSDSLNYFITSTGCTGMVTLDSTISLFKFLISKSTISIQEIH